MNPLRFLCGIFGRHRGTREEAPAPSPQGMIDPMVLMTPDQVRRLLAHARNGELTEAERKRAVSRILARYHR